MPLFCELRVWKAAYKLSLIVYKATAGFPKSETYGLTSQIRRAVVSVGANIAEGQRRRTSKDFGNFLAVAEGSLAELQHCLMLAKDLSFLDEDNYQSIAKEADSVEKMLVRLQQSLKKQSQK